MSSSLPPPSRLAKSGGHALQAWRNIPAHLKGKSAEIIALCYLLACGYRPAPRPLRALAQTDLLLRKGSTLILVEVKARSSSARAHLALTPQQKQRLIRQAATLAARHSTLTIRLDLLLLYPHAPFLTHLKNI